MPQLTLGPFTAACGEITLPGSKSISNRTLLLAALAHGETTVRGLLRSDDTEVMLKALAALGVAVGLVPDEEGGDAYRVRGCGGDFPVKDVALFLGNAGTAFRPLTAALALAGGHYRLSGVARMHERPIGDLVDGLRPLGTAIRYTGQAGYPPLEILPAADSAAASIAVRGDVSSQFLTALLLSLPLRRIDTRIEVSGELISKPYVEITLNLLERFGVTVRRDGWHSFTVPGGVGLQSPGTIQVEGDASSASYFLAAGAIAGGPVRVHGVGRASIQGDVRFADTLAAMGATIAMGEDWIEARAPASGRLKAIDADLNHIPDAAMTIAMAALFADGTTRIRNIASWRVKETDRISAMATELRKLGATVEEGADFIGVTPPPGFAAARTVPAAGSAAAVTRAAAIAPIDTYDDHRMAMCFSLAALAGVPITINDPACVGKTFPAYFDAFTRIAR